MSGNLKKNLILISPEKLPFNDTKKILASIPNHRCIHHAPNHPNVNNTANICHNKWQNWLNIDFAIIND